MSEQTKSKLSISAGILLIIGCLFALAVLPRQGCETLTVSLPNGGEFNQGQVCR
jgi:hypothetical protein